MEYKEGDIITIERNSHRTQVYHFTCCGDECENIIKVQKSALKRHSGKCMSCTQRKRPYEHIFNELRSRSDKIKLEFTLTFSEFLSVLNIGECHYCEDTLEYSMYTRDNERNYTSRAHKLDKKDPKGGYTFDNVVPCCWKCNRTKSDAFTYEEFLLLAPALREIRENKQ